MCGIAGIIAPWGAQKLQQTIVPMTRAIAHRGPDAEGFYVDEAAALGHRRLSIIDLSTGANQPLTDASDRYVIIYNGEVYNFEEIRAALPDYPWQTHGDTEAILAAYAHWGVDCLQRFNGMFALAIWDKQEQRLFLARDRMGIKPLYFFQQEGRLLFASEIRALLASAAIDRQLDPRALVDYLSYNTVHAPNTLVKGIQQLMPGEYALFHAGKWEQHSFWNIQALPANGAPHDLPTVRRRIRELLGAAVERRLVSDVPLGAFLSGGIDSSAIVALMAQVSPEQVNTFSVVFQEAAYDESHWSELIARKYNTRHTPILLKPADFLRELPHALQAMDTPSGDGVNSYVVSKVTRAAGITVALSGLGGDELFAGYPVFGQWMKLYQRRGLWKVPQALRSMVGAVAAATLRNHKASRLRELLSVPVMDLPHSYPIFRKLLSDRQLTAMNPLLPASFNAVSEMLAGHAASLAAYPQLSQVSVGEITSYTQNVLLRDTDQMSMAHALEVRVPFFDHTLVEYLLQVPDELKYPHTPKALLVDSLGELIPREIVERPKMGFVFPWEQWMRGELKSFCADRIVSLAGRGLFHAPEVLGKWERFLTRDKQVQWLHVWLLVVLEEWLQNNGF